MHNPDENEIMYDEELIKQWLNDVNTSDRTAIIKSIRDAKTDIKNSITWAAGAPDEESQQLHLMIAATSREYINRLEGILKSLGEEYHE